MSNSKYVIVGSKQLAVGRTAACILPTALLI